MRNLYIKKQKKIAKLFFEEYKNSLHKKEYSSSNRYYKDLFVNLLICQEGVCAYTEMALDFDYENYLSKWENGKFTDKKPFIDADIEHFYPKSKSEITEHWNWDNLFLVSKHVNQKKSNNTVPLGNELKPDNKKYEPSDYFYYVFDFHRFVPNPKLYKSDSYKYKQISEAIEILGLNSQTAISRRRKMLLEYLKDVYESTEYLKMIDKIIKDKLKEFYTAFEMSQHVFIDKTKAKKYIYV